MTLSRSRDRDPADRRTDRVLPYLGLLDDAAPVFRAGTRVPHAGVLCALPALADSGIVRIARNIYGSLGPAFYGLRTTLVARLLMARLRIKRPEGLKEQVPDDLGRILGLDRAFEVKTLRRKLTRLARVGRAAAFGRALAEHRIAARGTAIGFLYVDGHARVYHGQRTLPKAHVARMRLAMPASYRLADQGVRLLRGTLRLRQVTRLSDNGHQTPMLTSRRDLSAAEVAFRMFERWRQENFFKYLREEYALDALVDYAVVPDNPERDVPNPRRITLTKKLQHARAAFDQLTVEYGAEAFVNPEPARPTMRGFTIAHGALTRRLRDAFTRITTLERTRAALPDRVPVRTVTAADVVKLAPERHLLTSLITMVAYHAESDLVHRLTPHYRRTADDGRTLVQSALMSAPDLTVTEDELRVTLAPLSAPHRTRASPPCARNSTPARRASPAPGSGSISPSRPPMAPVTGQFREAYVRRSGVSCPRPPGTPPSASRASPTRSVTA